MSGARGALTCVGLPHMTACMAAGRVGAHKFAVGGAGGPSVAEQNTFPPYNAQLGLATYTGTTAPLLVAAGKFGACMSAGPLLECLPPDIQCFLLARRC